MLYTCRSKRSHSLHPGNTSFDSASSLIGGRTSPQKGFLNRSLDTAAYEKAKSAPKGFLNKSFDERSRRSGDSRSTTPTPEATSPKVLRKHTSTPSPRSEVISPTPQGHSSRKSSLVVTEISKTGAEGQTNSIKQFSSTKGATISLSRSDGGYNFTTPKKTVGLSRPVSARERGRTSVVTPGPYGTHSRQRSRSRERTMSEGSQQQKAARSRSVGATELSRQLTSKNGPLSAKRGNEVLMVSRNELGKHIVAQVANGSTNNNNNVRNGDEFKRPMTPRVQITPDRILPDKPKFLNRTLSGESSDSSSNGTVNSDNLLNGTLSKTPGRHPRLSKTSRSLSFSSTLDDDDELDPPPEDRALNEKMERLFQEYLKLELGTNGEDSKYTFTPSCSRKASDSSEGSGSLSSYNSYSTRSASSFQKSCSSSREDILASNSTSGRSSPLVFPGSAKKGPFAQTSATPKHSTNSRNMPITPKPATKTANTKENIRPSTPVRGRSGSLTRSGSRPPSAASNASSDATSTSRHPATPRARTSSREDLLDDNKPRGRAPVKTVPQERGRTPTRSNDIPESGRTPTRASGTQERGRTPTRGGTSHERGRTPTRTVTNKPQERGRTPTRVPAENRIQERGRTPVRGDSSVTSGTAAVRARSRSRDVLRNNSGELSLASSAASSKSASTPRPSSAQAKSKARDVITNQRADARTPVPQKSQPKPSTPARPASARANPYQRRGSREELLDGSRSRAQTATKPTTPARPASARANPYHQRSRSREDLLDGGSHADRSRARAVTSASRQRSASTNVVLRNKLTVNEDKAAQASPPRDILPGQLDLDLTVIESRMSAKPRKDEKPGRTKIPMPNHQRLAQSDSSTPLKRFDSGVDIATISPTESSIHGDEMWQNDILCSKMAQAGATYSHSSQNDVSHGQPSLNYNCFDDDDDSEYF